MVYKLSHHSQQCSCFQLTCSCESYLLSQHIWKNELQLQSNTKRYLSPNQTTYRQTNQQIPMRVHREVKLAIIIWQIIDFITFVHMCIIYLWWTFLETIISVHSFEHNHIFHAILKFKWCLDASSLDIELIYSSLCEGHTYIHINTQLK